MLDLRTPSSQHFTSWWTTSATPAPKKSSFPGPMPRRDGATLGRAGRGLGPRGSRNVDRGFARQLWSRCESRTLWLGLLVGRYSSCAPGGSGYPQRSMWAALRRASGHSLPYKREYAGRRQ
jgi:hypothetical protein